MDLFEIKDNQFKSDNYGTDSYLKNWPMLYILENGKQAYIGQSTNVINRMAQHKMNANKQMFTGAHFIYSKIFNQSVTFDYEAKLIQLFAADEKFVVTNANAGLVDKDYCDKAEHDENFKKLWTELIDKKLVKHKIQEIWNSDLFKYSPFKKLNDCQLKAAEDIFQRIESDEEQAIIVDGMPGSGKTILAIYLFKYLRDYVDEQGNQPYINKKMALVVPQTSLRKTLKSLFKQIYGLKSSDVKGPSEIAKDEYDIVLVDEAHRLHQRKNIVSYGGHDKNNQLLGLPKDATELDWILKQAKIPILFFDEKQVIGPSGINKKLFNEKVKTEYVNKTTFYYTLDTQMRVKGGNSYIDYVQALLNGKVAKKIEFENYDFLLFDKFDDFEKMLIKKEKEKKLARMIAGYAWPWISKKDKSLKDIKIENSARMWNNRTENWVNCDTAINEVGCIHSIQGYDLNNAFVILGNDIGYDKKSGEITVNPNQYFDKNGKNTASKEELLTYIKNVYYVLMTRGFEGTYLYVCNEDLKDWLSNYIDVV